MVCAEVHRKEYLLCLVDENGFKYACSVMKVFLQQFSGYFTALQLPQKTTESGMEKKTNIDDIVWKWVDCYGHLINYAE